MGMERGVKQAVEAGRRDAGLGWEMATGGVAQHAKRSEWAKTALALAAAVVLAMSNAAMVAVAHEMGVRGQRLSDSVFELVPPQNWALALADVCTGLGFLLFLLLAFCHATSAILLRRFGFVVAVLYFLRITTLGLTQLTPSFSGERLLRTCDDQTAHFSPVQLLGRAGLSMLTLGMAGSGKIPCGDLLYSGHTILLVSSSVGIWEYAPPRLLALKAFSWLVTGLGMVFLVISRAHYSVDVFVSAMLGLLLWAHYHSLVGTPHALRRPQRMGFLAVFVDWLEEDVPASTRLVTALYYPFGWPACLPPVIDVLNQGAYSWPTEMAADDDARNHSASTAKDFDGGLKTFADGPPPSQSSAPPAPPAKASQPPGLRAFTSKVSPSKTATTPKAQAPAVELRRAPPPPPPSPAQSASPTSPPPDKAIGKASDKDGPPSATTPQQQLPPGPYPNSP